MDDMFFEYVCRKAAGIKVKPQDIDKEDSALDTEDEAGYECEEE